MNIVLIGYRGSGKSETGSALAARLGWPCVSTDALIAAAAGMPIADFVAARGWDAFRDLETRIVAETAERDSTVIDTGGGAVVRPENAARLRKNGYVVWLRAAAETIRDRIGADTGRPSLTGAKSFLDEIGEVLAERTPLYQSAADASVDTDGKVPDTIAGEILERLAASGRRL